MTEKSVYIALGSNLGERQQNLAEALRRMAGVVRVTAVSRLYETEPAYVLDQPAFLNAVVAGYTGLSAPDLLAYLKQLETQLGRKTLVRYGPRNIDLDIIFYDDLVLDSPHLTIPHPRMAERGFVMHPLTDIAPDLVHPQLERTMAQLLADLPAADGVMQIKPWLPLNGKSAGIRLNGSNGFNGLNGKNGHNGRK